MTPCLFSATHWYMPASDSVSADTDRTPSSTRILSCEETRLKESNYWCGLKGSFCLTQRTSTELDAHSIGSEGLSISVDQIRIMWRSMKQPEDKTHFSFYDDGIVRCCPQNLSQSVSTWRSRKSNKNKKHTEIWVKKKKKLGLINENWIVFFLCLFPRLSNIIQILLIDECVVGCKYMAWGNNI